MCGGVWGRKREGKARRLGSPGTGTKLRQWHNLIELGWLLLQCMGGGGCSHSQPWWGGGVEVLRDLESGRGEVFRGRVSLTQKLWGVRR